MSIYMFLMTSNRLEVVSSRKIIIYIYNFCGLPHRCHFFMPREIHKLENSNIYGINSMIDVDLQAWKKLKSAC